MKDKFSIKYHDIIILFLVFLLLITLFSSKKDNTNLNNLKNNNDSYNYKLNNYYLNNINIKNKNIFLENSFLRIKISNYSGQISEVLLKNYKNYNNSFNKNLFLITKNSSSFGFIIKDSNNKKINTKNLLFKTKFFETKNSLNIVMRSFINKIDYIEYIYMLDKHGYDLSFFMRISNSLINSNPIKIYWRQYALNVEKNIDWEKNYTQLYYSYGKTSNIKYLSESSNDNKYLESINWIAAKQQFFVSIFSSQNPIKNIKLISYFSNSKNILKKFQFYGIILNNSKKIKLSSKWYFGPIKYNILKKYNNNYEEIIPFGWGILKWLNIYFFLNIFNILSNTYLNYGFIIIIMTIVVKLILSPITYNQYKLTAMMKIIKPELDKLNIKFKKNESIQKQKAIIEIYRKTGINPMSGCLPAILQIPIFYSLFKFFPTLIDLRGKSFLWADDLTSYDSIINLPFYLPIYGDHISLFTILYTLALLFYTQITSNTNISSEQVSNMKIVMYLVPIMMLLFINNYSAGLSLYYFMSNILNILIIFIINKFILNEEKIRIKMYEKNSNKENIKLLKSINK